LKDASNPGMKAGSFLGFMLASELPPHEEASAVNPNPSACPIQ
jgi:hypothetical protein